MKLSSLLQHALVSCVDFCSRRAVAVLLVALLSVAGAGVYVVRNLSIDTDVSEMLSDELPFRKTAAELDAAFPQFADEIDIIIDGDTPDIAEDAAGRLADRLRADPKLFGVVFHPESDPFFRRNGLLYMETSDIEDASDRLAGIQPLLAALWRNPSLQGLFEVLGQAVEQDSTNTDVTQFFELMARVAQAQHDRRFGEISWRELISGSGETRKAVVIEPTLDYSTLHPAAKVIAAIREQARQLELDESHGVHLRLTGTGALAHEELLSVEDSIGMTNVIALGVVCVLLLVCLRSIRLVIPVMLTLLMGLVWSSALAVLLVGSLNVLSVAFAVLFIGIGVDFGIHFALRYREGMAAAPTHLAALRWASAGISGPLTLCAVAAGIGFFSFLPTHYRGLGELGLVAGASMFVALAANLTVLPAFLSLIGPRPEGARHKVDEGMQAYHEGRMFRFRRPIVVGALVLGVAAAVIAPHASFDFDPLHLKDPHSESVRTLTQMMREGDNSAYMLSVLAANADEANAMAAKFSKLEAVAKATTIGDFIPANQDDKLSVISNMALFLSPLFTVEEKPKATPADARVAWAVLSQKLVATGGKAAGHLRAAMAGLDIADDAVLSELERRLLGGLPRQMGLLREAMGATPMTLADLPSDIRARYIAADGRTRVDVEPKENQSDHVALRRFVESVRTVSSKASGNPVVILEAGKTVIDALRTAMLVTLSVLLVVFWALLRNVRDVLLVFAPLVLAALLTVALMVIIKLPFNYVNIVALPLLFGLGMANGIQFVYRERLETDPARLMRSSTPRAVIFSALATIDSFGSMALSPHKGTSSMGILLGIAITLTLSCTIIVLPALMRCFPARRRNPSSS